MTVKELKNALTRYDDEAPVILSMDAEGNGFMILDEISGEYWDGKEVPGRFDDLDELSPTANEGLKAPVLWPT